MDSETNLDRILGLNKVKTCTQNAGIAPKKLPWLLAALPQLPARPLLHAAAALPPLFPAAQTCLCRAALPCPSCQRSAGSTACTPAFQCANRRQRTRAIGSRRCALCQ